MRWFWSKFKNLQMSEVTPKAGLLNSAVGQCDNFCYSSALVVSRKQQMSPGCTASNTEVTKKSSLEATEKLWKRLSTDFGSGKWSGPNSLTERCPRGHFYSSSVSLTSCQRYSKLDPVGWLRCLVWNRAGCSAEVSPQVTACRNWSWCWSRDRSRGIQI